MRRMTHVERDEQVVRDLVELLHQGASADEFARRLALVDALPPDDPAKPALVETRAHGDGRAQPARAARSSASAACWR